MNADAELIALCGGFLALDALIRRWDASEADLAEEVSDTLVLSWWDMVVEITETRALTPAGRMLKIRAALAAVRKANDGYSPKRNALITSALADMTRDCADVAAPYPGLDLPSACQAFLSDFQMGIAA